MKVKGFDHLVLSVRDVDRSLRFFQDVLGLEALRVEEYRRGEAPFPSVRLSATSVIDIVRSKEPRRGQNVDHFCLVIEPTDLEGLAAGLKEKGVEVTGTPGRRWGAQGWGVSLYIKDPDGNTIELKCHPEGYK
ncbi:MAG: VOC family virulence protein [SAR202 cluster bacterium]|nr:VOC family virulence protein [SAR202 cluster bacterium]